VSSLPLVSLGIPTYNRAELLKQAIASAVAQDYPNLELVISDNASTDGTEGICREVCEQHPHIRYIRQPENRGASANFWELLNLAQGEYFMWLADDDWIDRTYISQCMQVMIEHPDYALVSGVPKYISKDGERYDGLAINLYQDSPLERVLAYYSEISENGIFYGVMRRSHLLQLPVYDVMGGDWLMIAAMAFLGKIKTLEQIHVHRNFTHWQGFEQLAVSHRWHPFQGQHPHLSIAVSAFNDITWVSPLYQSLSDLERRTLATKVFQIICKRGETKPSDTAGLLHQCLERLSNDLGEPSIPQSTIDKLRHHTIANLAKGDRLYWGDISAFSELLQSTPQVAMHWMISVLTDLLGGLVDQTKLVEVNAREFYGKLERSQTQHLLTYEELQRTYAALQESRSQHQATHDELQRTYDQYQQLENEYQESQVNYRQSQIDLKRSQHTEKLLQVKLEVAQTELNHTKTAQEKQQTRLHKTQTRLQAVKQRHQKTQAKLKALRREQQALQQQLEQIQGDRVWKLWNRLKTLAKTLQGL
jgi:glycosyltransferase domain-containing protein